MSTVFHYLSKTIYWTVYSPVQTTVIVLSYKAVWWIEYWKAVCIFP